VEISDVLPLEVATVVLGFNYSSPIMHCKGLQWINNSATSAVTQCT